MAAIVLTGSQIYVAGHDLTGDANQAMMSAEATVRQVSTFSSGGWHEHIPGVRSASLEAAGFWSTGADSIDDVEWAATGTTGRVVTFAPPGATEGGAAYMLQTVRTDYSFLGEHGEVAPFEFSAEGSDAGGLVRGLLALTKTASISSTGAIGSGVQFAGGVAAGESLYATLHVFPTAGTTVTVVVESDDNGSFTTPTTRGTIGPVTAEGGTWMTPVAGAITDDYFRFNVSAVTGSFTLAGAIGVR